MAFFYLRSPVSFPFPFLSRDLWHLPPYVLLFILLLCSLFFLYSDSERYPACHAHAQCEYLEQMKRNSFEAQLLTREVFIISVSSIRMPCVASDYKTNIPNNLYLRTPGSKNWMQGM